MTRRLVFEGAYVATVDAAGSEFAAGHVVVDDSRIVAVGDGPAPEWAGRASGDVTVERIDARGRLLTPGLVNTHHHLYQWLTRGIAQDSILFDWLVALYPTWARIDETLVEAGAEAGLSVLAKSGCTLAADHHYVFPAGSGDILGGIVRAAARVGIRLHGTRGSMDLGRSAGGLPPDFAVETTSAALEASAVAVEKYHDASPDAMTQIALAPCSPFSVTSDLLREAAVLGRSLGVRLHTHGSETVEEDAFCQERFGKTPTQYLDDLGWLGDDVWMAHSVHLDEHAIARFGSTGTGSAHCPSSNARLAAGIAPIPQLLAAGAPVGLGVDGSASNESGQLGTEIRQAVLMNRLRAGADGFSVRDGLRIATIGGARVLGRDADLGSIEVGKLADLALWDVSGVEFAGLVDPVAALGLASMPPVAGLFVGGDRVVTDGRLTTVDEVGVAEAAARATTELLGRV
ncbi:cytosine/adenosine deaminase-related metal-dependent hydrolase [Frondihabitans sp. PhB188]|nr:cytosine/adenosine deaminase-related metal-dependent hydrolase [Frondihabitans sp. PhB188]